MTFDNRTGNHAVYVNTADGVVIMPPSKYCARIICDQELLKVVEGIEVYRNTEGRVKNIPIQQEGIYYVVSGWVAEWMAANEPSRTDIFTPNMHPEHCVRSVGGNVTRTKSLLARWADRL